MFHADSLHDKHMNKAKAETAAQKAEDYHTAISSSNPSGLIPETPNE